MAENTKIRQNGMIEIIRFLCSFWVAYYHGFFPVLSDKFAGVNVSVDIFFMISGFFFLRSIEKYRDRPFKEGVRYIGWVKNKSIIVPIIIAATSVLICNVTVAPDWGGFNWPFSFLWFFVAQFVFTLLFYWLYRVFKRRFAFNIACGVIVCIFMCLFRLNIRAIDIPLRGPAMLAMGILLSQIPKIALKLKNELAAKRMTLAINIVGFVISFATALYLAYLPEYHVWKLHLFTLVVCPMLLYFATSISVKSKILNLLGEISIFIYLAQCPILLHYYYVSRDHKLQFVLLCICAAVMFVINRLVNRKKKLKKNMV